MAGVCKHNISPLHGLFAVWGKKKKTKKKQRVEWPWKQTSRTLTQNNFCCWAGLRRTSSAQVHFSTPSPSNRWENGGGGEPLSTVHLHTTWIRSQAIDGSTEAHWKQVCPSQSQQAIQEIKQISRRCCGKNIQNELISIWQSVSGSSTLGGRVIIRGPWQPGGVDARRNIKKNLDSLECSRSKENKEQQRRLPGQKTTLMLFLSPQQFGMNLRCCFLLSQWQK